MPNILTEFAEFQQHSRDHGPPISPLDDTQTSDILNFSQHSPSVVNWFSMFGFFISSRIFQVMNVIVFLFGFR